MLAVRTLIGFGLSARSQLTPKKEEAKAALKKDGTPDKRFNENKKK
jgi:hypothetical protein